MSNKKSALVFALLASLLLMASPAQATFHLWTINEVFSSADGTVQFIELSSTVTGQENLSGHTLVATDGAQGSNSFQFTSNLGGDTANKTVLLATATFASLTGLTPDYTIPSGFLFVDGGTLNFAEGSSTLTYSAAQLPKNGVQSINRDLQAQNASPKNYAGLGATVSINTYASFDSSTNIMHVPVLDAPGIGIGNVSFSVDLGSLAFSLQPSFYLYAAGVAGGNTPAVFENGSTLYVPGLIVGDQLYEFRMGISSGDPIIFASPQIISVSTFTPAQPQSPAEPTPEQQSSARGLTQFANQCAICHGASGGGGIGPSLADSSFNTFASLRSQIDANMPQGNPAACRDQGTSTCATDVANYVLSVIQGGSGASGPEEPTVTY